MSMLSYVWAKLSGVGAIISIAMGKAADAFRAITDVWQRRESYQLLYPEKGHGALRPQIGHRSKRFDEFDHSTTLTGIGQRAAHRAGIVRHVTGIAGPRDHRGHTRVAEQIF
jgi:hypothetical protein